MALHAWKGYKDYAWGADELNPISKTKYNWYGNYSLFMTPVDALDTLWIMGARQEFEEAKKLVLENLDFNIPIEVSAFEVSIRILGGLLSAYDLCGDRQLLDKAVDLADRLLPIFETPTGIPVNRINLQTQVFLIYFDIWVVE